MQQEFLIKKKVQGYKSKKKQIKNTKQESE